MMRSRWFHQTHAGSPWFACHMGVVTVVPQAQPRDAGDQGLAGALDRDVDHPTMLEHARAAQHRGESFGRGLRWHGDHAPTWYDAALDSDSEGDP